MGNQEANIEEIFIAEQQALCKKFEADYLSSSFNQLIGVALESFERFDMPINGLRHAIENESSANWFIWSGEYSDDPDFFRPVHIRHLLEICPKAIKYLGLPPGWRFLFDNNYEDVWFDDALLKGGSVLH